MDMQELDERYREALSYKGRWLGLYQDLYIYVIPNRDAFNVKFNYLDAAKPTFQNIYDDTAPLAAYERANDLHALLIPQDRNWGKVTMDTHMFRDDQVQQLKPRFDEMNERIMYFINQSNLARVVNGSNLDLVGGTAALWIEHISEEIPISFRSIPAVALYIEQTNDDLVETAWYQINMSARKIMNTFPKYKGKSLRALKDNPQEIHQVVFGQISIGEAGKEKYYIYAVLENDPHEALWEVERTYKQIIVYRDRVRPGEADGRGIGLDLLPTIKDLNEMRKEARKDKATKARPPMFYDNDKMFNPHAIRRWSGAMIARQPGGRNPIEALQMPTYPEVREEILMMQDIIKKGFQVDPLGEINNPVKTATEISIRENRAQRTSSTDISRLINELPKQIYETVAKILNESLLLFKDRKPNDFPSFKKLRFDFQSPLYDIQKSENIQKVAQAFQLKQQFFGEGSVMGSVNVGETNDYINDNLNIPSKLSKSKDEINQIMDAVAKQQAKAAQQQGMPTPSTSSSNVGLPKRTPQQF